MMLKRLAILTVLTALFSAVALAQGPLRVLVLPFDASGSAEPYSLGLAAGLQRGLNSLEGVFVPPVGDGALLVGRAASITDDLSATVTELFRAEAIVSGSITPTDAGFDVVLALSGPRFPEGKQVPSSTPAVSSSLVRTTLETTLSELGLAVDSAVQARLDTLTGQAPTAASMGSVGLAAARIGASANDLAGALELDGGSGWVHSEYARALMLSGQNEAALTASEQALALNPNDIEAIVNHGIVLSQLGRLDEAVAQYDAALAMNSWHATALAARAMLTSNTQQALGGLERATEAYPRLVDAWLDMVSLTGDNARALQQLRRAANYLPESIRIHRAFVQRTISAGDPQGALSYLRQQAGDALAASPSLYALVVNLPPELSDEGIALAREGGNAFPESTIPGLAEAFLLRRSGSLAEAETLLRTLNTAHPEDVEVVNQLAITVAAGGRVGEAQELFSSISGASTAVSLNLAQLLLDDGQAQAALEIVEPLAADTAADADTVTLYGLALAGTGNIDGARTAFEHALSVDPNWQPAQFALSQLNEQQQVTGGVTVEMPEAANAAFQRGLNALGSSDSTTALLEFNEAVSQGGGPLAEFYRGYVLQMSGQVREAISAYEAALEGLPESDVVLNNLGYSQLLVGRYDLALPLLRRAVAANAGNAQAHMNLGLTFYGLNRFSDAIAAWDQAVQLDPALQPTLESLMEEARSRSGQ